MKRPVADPQLSTTPLFKDLNKLKTVEELKAEVQNRLNIATMNPSPQNVERYIEANQFMLDKSTVLLINGEELYIRNRSTITR